MVNVNHDYFDNVGVSNGDNDDNWMQKYIMIMKTKLW